MLVITTSNSSTGRGPASNNNNNNNVTTADCKSKMQAEQITEELANLRRKQLTKQLSKEITSSPDSNVKIVGSDLTAFFLEQRKTKREWNLQRLESLAMLRRYKDATTRAASARSGGGKPVLQTTTCYATMEELLVFCQSLDDFGQKLQAEQQQGTLSLSSLGSATSDEEVMRQETTPSSPLVHSSAGQLYEMQFEMEKRRKVALLVPLPADDDDGDIMNDDESSSPYMPSDLCADFVISASNSSRALEALPGEQALSMEQKYSTLMTDEVHDLDSHAISIDESDDSDADHSNSLNSSIPTRMSRSVSSSMDIDDYDAIEEQLNRQKIQQAAVRRLQNLTTGGVVVDDDESQPDEEEDVEDQTSPMSIERKFDHIMTDEVHELDSKHSSDIEEDEDSKHSSDIVEDDDNVEDEEGLVHDTEQEKEDVAMKEDTSSSSDRMPVDSDESSQATSPSVESKASSSHKTDHDGLSMVSGTTHPEVRKALELVADDASASIKTGTSSVVRHALELTGPGQDHVRKAMALVGDKDDGLSLTSTQRERTVEGALALLPEDSSISSRGYPTDEKDDDDDEDFDVKIDMGFLMSAGTGTSAQESESSNPPPQKPGCDSDESQYKKATLVIGQWASKDEEDASKKSKSSLDASTDYFSAVEGSDSQSSSEPIPPHIKEVSSSCELKIQSTLTDSLMEELGKASFPDEEARTEEEETSTTPTPDDKGVPSVVQEEIGSVVEGPTTGSAPSTLEMNDVHAISETSEPDKVVGEDSVRTSGDALPKVLPTDTEGFREVSNQKPVATSLDDLDVVLDDLDVVGVVSTKDEGLLATELLGGIVNFVSKERASVGNLQQSGEAVSIEQPMARSLDDFEVVGVVSTKEERRVGEDTDDHALPPEDPLESHPDVDQTTTMEETMMEGSPSDDAALFGVVSAKSEPTPIAGGLDEIVGVISNDEVEVIAGEMPEENEVVGTVSTHEESVSANSLSQQKPTVLEVAELSVGTPDETVLADKETSQNLSVAAAEEDVSQDKFFDTFEEQPMPTDGPTCDLNEQPEEVDTTPEERTAIQPSETTSTPRKQADTRRSVPSRRSKKGSSIPRPSRPGIKSAQRPTELAASGFVTPRRTTPRARDWPAMNHIPQSPMSASPEDLFVPTDDEETMGFVTYKGVEKRRQCDIPISEPGADAPCDNAGTGEASLELHSHSRPGRSSPDTHRDRYEIHLETEQETSLEMKVGCDQGTEEAAGQPDIESSASPLSDEKRLFDGENVSKDDSVFEQSEKKNSSSSGLGEDPSTSVPREADDATAPAAGKSESKGEPKLVEQISGLFPSPHVSFDSSTDGFELQPSSKTERDISDTCESKSGDSSESPTPADVDDHWIGKKVSCDSSCSSPTKARLAPRGFQDANPPSPARTARTLESENGIPPVPARYGPKDSEQQPTCGDCGCDFLGMGWYVNYFKTTTAAGEADQG